MANIFRCLNDSPMTAHRPDWQTEFMNGLDMDKVLKADAEFRKLMNEALEHAQPGFTATAIIGAMNRAHAIEHFAVNSPSGKRTAIVNYLTHTVEFVEG